MQQMVKNDQLVDLTTGKPFGSGPLPAYVGAPSVVRTKAPKGLVLQQQVQVLSALLSRAKLMARLGQQYGGDRDLYTALGYDVDPRYEQFAAHYERQDIAKAVINRPVEGTWRGLFEVTEVDDDEETPFEKAWKDLQKALTLKQRFMRVDKLSSLGSYGVLLFGFDDVKDIGDFRAPVAQGKRTLLYLKPLGEGSAEIKEWVEDTKDPRYGQPMFYDASLKKKDDQETTRFYVHHSRILHISGELLESEVQGVPVLKVLYNRLMDLEKIVGGSAEMFWRGARPGYQGKLDPEYTMSTQTAADLQSQIDEYEHNLRRIMVNEGIDLKALTAQVSDPTPHVDVQLQMISAVTGIPKRILTGSERGELASSEDRDAWNEKISDRREEHAEPQIVRPFIDRCIEHGVLPTPKEEYTVIWPDLFAPSEKEKAEVGKIRATAIKEYGANVANQEILPLESFLKHVLGFSDELIELIAEQREAQIIEEEADFKEEPEEEEEG